MGEGRVVLVLHHGIRESVADGRAPQMYRPREVVHHALGHHRHVVARVRLAVDVKIERRVLRLNSSTTQPM